MRIIFAGSPLESKTTLEELFNNQSKYNFNIVGVLSNPPAIKNRGKVLTHTPVTMFAKEHNIPAFTPEHLDTNLCNEISKLNPDLLVCFSYGHIFGPKFLNIFPLGGINIHPSLLPKYRGPTPIQTAIINNDYQSAVTIQKLSLGLDEGNIIKQVPFSIEDTDTTEYILRYTSLKGAYLILNIIQEYNNTNIFPEGTPQIGLPSYTIKISKKDGYINWNSSAQYIHNQVRAYSKNPGCYCLDNNNQIIKIHKTSVFTDVLPDINNYQVGQVINVHKQKGILVKTGNGIIAIQELQKQGKSILDYKSFINGARNFIGSVLQ